MKKVILINDKNKAEKQVNMGYSFLTLFLNFLVPLFRKDLPGLIMILAYDMVAYVFWRDLGQVFTPIVGLLLLPIFYNKLYLCNLEEKGYEVKEIVSEKDHKINFAA